MLARWEETAERSRTRACVAKRGFGGMVLTIRHISGSLPRPRPASRRRAASASESQPFQATADNFRMSMFTHERLDVYQAAIEFLVLADPIASALPKGRAYVADQLRSAALSIPLNVAEGAGEFASGDKARFYRMARRSGTECAAILHACRVLNLATEDSVSGARQVLDRVVAMLTAMVRQFKRSGAGADADADA